MSIVLHCNLCGAETEDVDPVLLELQHWLIIRHPHSVHGEEHFCRKCRSVQEKFMNKQKELVAERQENE